MKKQCCFLFALLSVASHLSLASAASYRYQVEPVGAHQYVIRLESDAPQPFSMMLEGMKQKAQEVCGGYYRILQIDPETTQNILAMVECQTSQPLTTSPSMKQRQPIIQEANAYEPVNDNQITRKQADSSFVENRLGVGLLTNAFDFGIGPCVEFWLGKRIGIMGYYTALFDYTTLGGRIDFMPDTTFYLFQSPMKPYLGAGYAHVKGPEISYAGAKVEQEGNGIEAHAGMLYSASWLLNNLFFRGEVIYNFFDLEIKGSAYGETVSSAEIDWSSITLGAGISYFF